MVVVLAAWLLNACTAPQETNRIYRRGTEAYDSAVKNMPIDELQALKLLRAATKDYSPIFVFPRPLFFVNEEYCFGTPEKTFLPLTGYYVNAKSGRILFRGSKKIVTRQDRFLPVDAYEHVTVISEGQP